MRLHTATWGTGPRTALLVHGITSSAETWWEIAEGLAAGGYAVTAVDLRGHGRSDRATGYRMAELAADVVELARRWDLAVGHSLGGPVLVTAFQQQPDLAGRLVLVDPALRRPPGAVQEFVDSMLTSLTLTDPQLWRDQEPHWPERTVQARVSSFEQADPDGVRAIIETNQPWDWTAAARAVQVPVSVLAADPGLGAAFTAELGDELGWPTEVVLGAGHSVHRDRPGLVLERLLR